MSGAASLALVTSILLSAACAGPAAPLTPITVQFRFTHQAQFAGLYVADRKGYFAAEGLKVTFRETVPGADHLGPVADGTAEFGVAAPEQMLLRRSEGAPLRAIGVVYRRSPSVVFALASSGIRRPADLAGKRVQVNAAADDLFRTLLARAGVPRDRVTVARLTPGLADLYEGRVDARSGFLINEVLAAERAGHRLNLIFYEDYGIRFYSDTLITTDAVIASRPELVERFLRAALRGWSEAVRQPDAAADLVSRYRPSADSEHERAMMRASLPLVQTGEDRIGWMRPEVWAGMERTLREQGTLARPLDVTSAYTLDFLRRVHPDQALRR